MRKVSVIIFGLLFVSQTILAFSWTEKVDPNGGIMPVVNCKNSANETLVVVYGFFGGPAGIDMRGTGYFIHPQFADGPAKPAILEMSGDNGTVSAEKWSIKLTFFTTDTFETELVEDGVKTPLSCMFVGPT